MTPSRRLRLPWLVLTAGALSCALVPLAGCELIVDTRGRCLVDVDCLASERCQAERCVPRTSPVDAGHADAAPAVTVLAFTTAPQTVAIGACSSVVTLQNRDLEGGPVVATSDRAIALTVVPAAGLIFSSDASCSAASTGATLALGNSSTSFWFKGEAVGNFTMTASGTGFSSAVQTASVVAGEPARLAFTTPAQTLVAGVCSAVITVDVQDALGNLAEVAADTAVYLTSTSSGGAFYVDPVCLNSVSSMVVASGGHRAGVYYKDAVPGNPTLTALATGLLSTTQVATIDPAGVRLVFATPSRTLQAGDCSQVLTVQAQDQAGQAFELVSTTPLELSTTSSSGAFFTDPGCATPLLEAAIAAGTDQTSFHYQDRIPGTPTLTVATGGLVSAVQEQTVAAAAPTRLVFASAAQSVVAGECSAALRVQVRDASGNPARAQATASVGLASTSSAGQFFEGVPCTTSTTALALASGASEVRFHFMDPRAGTPTLTVSTSGLSAATQVETVTPAAPSQLVFTTPAQTLNVDSCSAALMVGVRDDFDNTSPVAGTTVVDLASTSGTTVFHADAVCGGAVASRSLAAGESQVEFFVEDSAIGAPTITATAGGLTDATQVLTLVAAGAATRLAFTTAPQSLDLGTCSAVTTVQLQDSHGTTVSATGAMTVQLSSDSAGVTFFLDAGCSSATSAVQIAGGADSASFYFASDASGTPTLRAEVTGLTLATQGTTIRAPAAHLAFASAQQTLLAGACSAVMTVQAQDGFGNPAAVATATTLALATTSSTGAFYSDAACATSTTEVSIGAAGSAVGFYYRDTTAGLPALTVTASGLTEAVQTEIIDPAPASRLAFTTAPQSMTAGTCSAALAVEARDSFNNRAPVAAATTVALSSTSGEGTFYTSAGCGDQVTSVAIAAGSDTVGFYFKDTRAGSPTLTAAATMFGSATQLTTVRAAAPSRLAFTTSPQSVNAGACSAVLTVELRDVHDNVAAAEIAITVQLSSSAGTSTFDSDPTCGNAVTGRVIAIGASQASFYFKDSAAGTPTITASADSLTSATQQVNVQAGAGATRLAFISSPQTVTAGACSTGVTVQAQNSAGTPTSVSSATAIALSSSSSGNAFFAGAGCTGPITSIGIAAGGNQASFYFKDTVTGTPTLTATAGGLTPAAQTQTVTPGSGPRLAIITAPLTIGASTCSSELVFQSQDAYGNPLANAGPALLTVTLTASPATGFFFHKKNDSSCTRDAYPSPFDRAIGVGLDQDSFRFVATAPGTYTITASAPGYTSATQQETAQ